MGELPRTVHFQLLHSSGWCGYACIVRLMLQILVLKKKNVHSFHLKSEVYIYIYIYKYASIVCFETLSSRTLILFLC